MDVQPLILAAGKGTRMGGSIPKPLIRYRNKALIHHVIDACVGAGLPTPIVVVPKNDISITTSTLQCSHAEQLISNGTGSACAAGLSHVQHPYTLVLYADHPHIASASLRQFCTELTSSSIVMGVTNVPHFNAPFHGFSSWGRVIRDTNNNVLKVVEASDASEDQLLIHELNSSPYIFPTQWLRLHTSQLTTENEQGEYYLTDLIHRAVDDRTDIRTHTFPPHEIIGVNTTMQLESLAQFSHPLADV